MISGHGDDIYRYKDVRINFSSNIYQHADHSALKAHLTAHLDLMANYPEPEPWSLQRAIARKHGIDERSVLVTNGATDAIYLVAQTFAGTPCHIQQPTFSEYEDACTMYGCPMGHGHLAWFCNPNNPTGEVLALDDIKKRAGDHELLVIDQAYEHYTHKPLLTAQQAIDDGHIIQLHSLTKTYCVPGLRLGYITAAPSLIDRLRQHLRPWAVNALAIEAGRFLLAHDELTVRPDLAEASRLARRLGAIDGITVLPTDTNFMLCRHDRLTAATLKERLVSDHNILIRDASNFATLSPHHFRIAAQRPEENDILIAALSTL